MFITFEGIEGSGKSLQIAQAAAHLKKKGVPCLLTREPGGTRFGLALREVLLRPDGVQREPWSELLLYLADRHQHLKELIEPAIKQGQVVLCDRYHDATRAYQGAARGISQAKIDKAAKLLGILEPDKTILLDLEPKIGLARARRRNSLDPTSAAEGRFEEEDLSFHNRVREAYLNLSTQFPRRIHIVPASESPDEVSRQIADLLDQWLSKLDA